jgi:hypothetical protein
MPQLLKQIGPPRVAATTKPTWVEKAVVFRQPAGNILWAHGWSYGTLAVHPSLPGDGDPLVCVTHLPSLLAVCRFAEPDEAVKFTEALWDRCSAAFSARMEPVDLRKITPEVKAWILRCQAARKVVE